MTNRGVRLGVRRGVGVVFERQVVAVVCVGIALLLVFRVGIKGRAGAAGWVESGGAAAAVTRPLPTVAAAAAAKRPRPAGLPTAVGVAPQPPRRQAVTWRPRRRPT